MTGDLEAKNKGETGNSRRLGRAEIATIALLSLGMVLTPLLPGKPFSWTEVLGFITGGICVWLTVREHIATWPVGLSNNVLFFVLFWQARLFADAGLQIVYFALGIFGWWYWVHGGHGRTELKINRTSCREWFALLIMIPLTTWGLQLLLVAVQGSAPFWDALTTVLSLAAQALLSGKRLEHWLFWIAADVIYIPLYFSRDLMLTAVLYGVFLVMCLIGGWQWLARWRTATVVS